MVVSHNLLAMNAERMLNLTNVKQKKAVEKLSSGNRINRSADDAAGLAISEKLRRQIRGLTQATANCQDGISMVQIADGAMNEIADILHRGTELSVKAANGTLSEEDRLYIQKELEQLKDEINGISDRTTFNEIPVLKGRPSIESEVEYNGSMPSWATSAEMSSKYLSGTYTDAAGKYPGTHPSATVDFSAFTGTASQLDELASGDKGFNTTCATCDNHYTISFTTDATKEGVVSSGQHYIYTVNISGCTSGEQITDKIIAATGGHPKNHYTQFEKDSAGRLLIYDERTTSMVTASNAKFNEGIATAKMPEEFDVYIQAGTEGAKESRIEIKLPEVDTDLLGITGVNVRTQSNATASIASFKKALSYVSEERSRMGAYQNRLEHTVNNLNNVVENTTAAESAIRDTDMAKEMVSYSIGNVLAQLGQAMLAQANQNNQGVLSLIG